MASKALTKAQLIDQHLQELRQTAYAEYEAGKSAGRQAERDGFNHQKEAAKLQQLQAAAKLMEEITRAASRIGYMIGKINGDNSR
jgi:hypothetical protein